MSSEPPPPGIVTRAFSSTSGSKTISYYLSLDERQSWAPESDLAERALGTTSIIAAVGGCILIWDGAITGETSDDAAKRFFAGNSLAERPRAPLTYIDATQMPPLEEDEFWATIDLLERSTSRTSVARATRAIHARGRDFALRYAQTAALKALALVGTLSGHGVDGIGDSGDWTVLGAVLTQGRATYEGVLSGAVEFSPRWLRDSSSEALFLGSAALERIESDEFVVVTAYTPRHRRLLGFEDEDGIDDDALGGATGFTIMVAARGVIRQDDALRERIAIVPVRTSDELGEAAAALELFGGRVVAGPELDRSYRHMGLQPDRVFSTRQRSRATDDDYLMTRTSA